MKDIPLKKIPDKYFESWAAGMVRDHLSELKSNKTRLMMVSLLAKNARNWYNTGQHDLLMFLDVNLVFIFDAPRRQWEHLKLQWALSQGVKKHGHSRKSQSRTVGR